MKKAPETLFHGRFRGLFCGDILLVIPVEAGTTKSLPLHGFSRGAHQPESHSFSKVSPESAPDLQLFLFGYTDFGYNLLRLVEGVETTRAVNEHAREMLEGAGRRNRPGVELPFQGNRFIVRAADVLLSSYSGDSSGRA